jgi:hypothetical protein
VLRFFVLLCERRRRRRGWLGATFTEVQNVRRKDETCLVWNSLWLFLAGVGALEVRDKRRVVRVGLCCANVKQLHALQINNLVNIFFFKTNSCKPCTCQSRRANECWLRPKLAKKKKKHNQLIQSDKENKSPSKCPVASVQPQSEKWITPAFPTN